MKETNTKIKEVLGQADIVRLRLQWFGYRRRRPTEIIEK